MGVARASGVCSEPKAPVAPSPAIAPALNPMTKSALMPIAHTYATSTPWSSSFQSTFGEVLCSPTLLGRKC